jgi:hypothetical protein
MAGHIWGISIVKHHLFKSSIFLASVMLGTTAHAAGGFGVTAKVGTLGYGIEGTTNLMEKVNLRFGYQGANIDYDYGYETDNGVTANFSNQYEMGNFSVLLDFHSFSSAFRFTGGLMGNNFKLAGSAPTGNYQIGDHVYNVPMSATFETENSVAPYFGVGWGNAVDPKKKWILSADLGVLHTGKVNVKLSAPGVTASDIALEEQKMEDDIDKFRFYPVATIGVSYHF